MSGFTNKIRESIRDNGSEFRSEPRNDGREQESERELVRKAKLLWIDLEMTGLDPTKDKILEVAAIATDMSLNQIATFEAVVKVNKLLMKKRMVGEFWEKNSKSRDALQAQNSSGKPVREVEKELLSFIDQHFGKEIYLAGNSIHQDRKFIENEMPELNKRLHYRMLDVSAWKIYFENALDKKFIKPENHRALDDINGSIEELKWYLTFLK
ncbi:oligoribonuclease [Candidatus Saccharibacteria bacterium]|nr:oligoribonuclease [Candidatus Saccharibacteria bacterium]